MPEKKPVPPEQKDRTKCSACGKKLEKKVGERVEKMGSYSCGECKKKGLCEGCYAKHRCKK